MGRWSAWVSLVCVLGACDGASGGVPVRSSVRLVHQFGEVTVDCIAESSCPSYHAPTIVDVARDGEVVALLYSYPSYNGAFYSIQNGIIVSRDLGQTWTHLDQLPALDNTLESQDRKSVV
jgi:hypothetical protein